MIVANMTHSNGKRWAYAVLVRTSALLKADNQFDCGSAELKKIADIGSFRNSNQDPD
jgi:hypothetical protein